MRTKADRRHRAFAYRGNAYIIECSIAPVSMMRHPNRILQQFRASNRERKVA